MTRHFFKRGKIPKYKKKLPESAVCFISIHDKQLEVTDYILEILQEHQKNKKLFSERICNEILKEKLNKNTKYDITPKTQ